MVRPNHAKSLTLTPSPSPEGQGERILDVRNSITFSKGIDNIARI